LNYIRISDALHGFRRGSVVGNIYQVLLDHPAQAIPPQVQIDLGLAFVLYHLRRSDFEVIVLCRRL
jgi:hypothetical protein